MADLIKVGRVSAVDAARECIRATFPDRDNQVTGWLQAIKPSTNSAVVMPEIGQTVLCVFLGNGIETGYWLGVITS